ncbi:hypothetical protein Ahy_A05g023911 [Arachis hypogaea]|uniref:Cation/H+ exchanger domain-containing protein n=1 Tax=Arachis hypogaea TaxID=3818 RepID=A0A445D5J2_ARAHY|nr:hypothetical protein Ahy_A05g023911 [Arachis hypogaea]
MPHVLAALLEPSLLHVFATLSFIAEIFIFLYVGMDALDIENPGKSVGISSVLLELILVGRAAFKSLHVKIDIKQQMKRQENYSYMVVISTNSSPSYTREAELNDRKIRKLCEYASKNQLRIPKF